MKSLWISLFKHYRVELFKQFFSGTSIYLVLRRFSDTFNEELYQIKYFIQVGPFFCIEAIAFFSSHLARSKHWNDPKIFTHLQGNRLILRNYSMYIFSMFLFINSLAVNRKVGTISQELAIKRSHFKLLLFGKPSSGVYWLLLLQ